MLGMCRYNIVQNGRVKTIMLTVHVLSTISVTNPKGGVSSIEFVGFLSGLNKDFTDIFASF